MHSGKRRRRRTKARTFEQLESRHLMAVIINEFLASNTAGIRDQDNDRSDWIELKNTDSLPVDVGGWHLTDDETDLTKWTLPAVTIPAGGYLLVWASGKDRAVAGQELHTNFALSQAGEYLALVMPDGATVVDSFAPFPEQVSDISYGRGAGATVTDGLLTEFAQLKVLVPATNAVDGVWTAIAYNEATSSAGTWIAGQPGVGYDVNNTGGNLAPYVSTNVASLMNSSTRPTAYIRLPFEVANPADYTALRLRIRFDDGFAVYLNGTRINLTGTNAPATLAFNSSSTASRNDASAIAFQDFDLTAFKHLLVAGDNVLAIHGLNRVTSSTQWGDFLIDPRLEADRNLPGAVGYMVTPTPNAANEVGTLGVVADTKFSVDRGFFTAPFQVQITTTTADAVIRYTTDGSPPTATTGTVYNPASPPLITTTTTLRAAAFKTGWTPTNVDTQTYIFLSSVVQQNGAGLPPVANWGWQGPDWAMDPDVVNHPVFGPQLLDDLKAVPTVSLVMPWDHWFGGAGVGIYPTQSELERATSMEIFTADGSMSYQIDGGIEIAGGTSDDRWKQDKLSMRIKFKAPYGPEKFNASLFQHGVLDVGAAIEFNTLTLDAQSNYTWHYGGSSNPTDQRGRAKYIQDQFVADLQNLAGGKAHHGRAMHLYINGLYWGLYFVHERPDEHFAESYYGGNDADYDVIRIQGTAPDVVSDDEVTALANFNAMLNLARQDMSVPANYAAAAAKIDVDDLISYMIINYYVGNDDWAHHNWYATYNRVDPNGKWRFHSWDAEHVLKSLSYNAIQTGGYVGTPEEVHLLLMAADEYRLRFADLVHRHFYNNGLMTPANVAAIYQLRVEEVQQAIGGEAARWGDSRNTATEPIYYTKTNWMNTQNDLFANYFPFRTGVVQGQFNARNWSVPLGAPTFSQFGGEVQAGYALTLNKPSGSPATASIYYTLDGSDPRDPATNLPRASAILYAGPIIINAGQRVQARIFNDPSGPTVNKWSPVSDATFLLDTPFPLRIVEMNYNPAPFPGVADPQDLEYFELLNTGNQSISLDGVQIAEFAGTPYAFPNGLTLGAGERIIVARSPAAFQVAYGTGHNVSPTGYANANLSNGGERVKLLGPVGETLQDFTYSDAAPWPTAPDGGGKSLELIDPLSDPNVASNWRASYYRGGSPGISGLPPTFAGDADGDDDVDGHDFLAWQRGLGTAALRADASRGDADGDRDVDAADHLLWKMNYGSAPSAAAAAAAEAPVATFTLAVEAAPLANDEWILVDLNAPRRATRPALRARLIDEAFAATASPAPSAPPALAADDGVAASHVDAAWEAAADASATDLSIPWSLVGAAD